MRRFGAVVAGGQHHDHGRGEHDDDDDAGHYITYDVDGPAGHLMLFETDGQRVDEFRAGVEGPVRYPEGCA